MDKFIHFLPREIALERGISRYFTGEPCKRGHISERQTKSRNCPICKSMLYHSDPKNRKKSRQNQAARRARMTPEELAIEKSKKSRYAKEYWEENKEELKQQSRKRYYTNHEEKLKRIRESRASNPEYKRKALEWARRNRKKINEQQNARRRARADELNRKRRERYRNDPNYKADKICRDMLRRVLLATRSDKECSTFEYLGYSQEQFKSHIEKQFKKGMDWKNHGDWHIDHIVPISQMIEQGITSPSDINCLTNLKPVWAKENLSKGDRRIYLI